MDPREVQFAEQRQREFIRKAALHRLSQRAVTRRPRRQLIRPIIVWLARTFIHLGVRLFILSKTWEQRGNTVYNDVNEWEPLAVEAAAE